MKTLMVVAAIGIVLLLLGIYWNRKGIPRPGVDYQLLQVPDLMPDAEVVLPHKGTRIGPEVKPAEFP